ncbi:MAG: DUF3857 domain-containing protein [Myxococcota bacterium]
MAAWVTTFALALAAPSWSQGLRTPPEPLTSDALWAAWLQAESEDLGAEFVDGLPSREGGFVIPWMKAVIAQRRGDRATAVQGFEAVGLAPWMVLKSKQTKVIADALGPSGRIRAGSWTNARPDQEIQASRPIDFGRGGRVLLSVAAGGPWRLLIDGKVVARGAAGEMESQPVLLLGRGRHELELRFVPEEHGAIWLRASDGRGWPRPEVWRDTPDARPGEATSSVRSAALPAEKPSGPSLVQGLAEGLRGGPARGARVLSELVVLEPENAGAWAWLSRWDPSRRVEAAERSVELAPHDPAGWAVLAEACGDLRWRRAQLALREGLERAPEHPGLRRASAAFAFDRLDAGLSALRWLDPGRPLEAAERARMWESLGRPEQALAEARLALDALPMRTDLRSLVMRIEAKAGRPEVVLRQATSARALAPDLPRWWFATARWMRAVDTSAAEVALGQARARFPLHAEPLVIEAEWALMRGLPVRALIEQAARIEPERRDLRRWVAHTASERAELPPLPPVGPDERRHGAAVLLDERRFEVAADGWSRVQERVVRLLNPARAESLIEHVVAYAPGRERLEILDASLFRADGKVLPPSSIRDEAQDEPIDGMYVDTRHRIIRFESLEAGDVIRLVTRTESRGPDIFGGFVGSVEAVRDLWPVLEARVVLEHPVERPLRAFARGLQERPSRRREDIVRRTWTASSLAPIPREPLGPAYVDFGPFVSTSSYRDWTELARWYAELVRPQRILDVPTRAAGRRATEGLTEPPAIVDRLFRLTVDETRYVGIELGIHGWKPHKASEVFRRGYGDCKDKATLLSAWLADHGIASSIVLVRTADRGLFPEEAPSMWAFNHAVLYVPSLDRFLDPTAEFTPSMELPSLDQGAMGLVVPVDGEGRLVRLPLSRAEDNANEGQVTVSIEADGRMSVDGREHFLGAPAADARRDFEDQGSRIERLEQQLSAIFPGLELARARFEDQGQAFVYEYEAAIGSHGRLSEAQLRIPTSLYRHELSDAYAGPSERSTDLVLAHPWRTRNEVDYRLPVGARVASLPDPVEVRGPNLSFKQSIEATKLGFKVVDEVEISKRRLDVADYPEFRQACRAADEAMRREIVIELP